jgi:hypothetical protein
MSDSKLVGVGRVGDFVHAGQTMGTENGEFKNVSRLWIDQCHTFEWAISQIDDGIRHRKDHIVEIGDVFVNYDVKGIIVEVGDLGFRPTDHAARQLGGRAYNVPQTAVNFFRKDAMKSEDEVLFERDERDHACLAEMLNNAIRRVKPDYELRMRTYDDDTLRAVVSTAYSPVDNRWFLETLSELIPGGLISHWKGKDPDTLWTNILLPDSIREESDSDYGGMFSVGNCEIGLRTLSHLASLFRAICMNGNIWDQTKGNKNSYKHIGIDLDVLSIKIAESLTAQIPLLKFGIDKFLNTRKMRIKDVNAIQVIATISETFSMSRLETALVAQNWLNPNDAEQKDGTLFGIINAVTRTGQQLSEDRWVDFDTIGGKLTAYSEDKWANLLDLSKRKTDEEVMARLPKKVLAV